MMSVWDDVWGLILDVQEDVTKYIGVIGSDHAYIHKGIGFNAFIDTGSISSAYRIGFTTPVTPYIHWRPLGITSSAAYTGIVMTEADSFSSGTTVTPVNRNRPMSATASAMQTFSKGVTSTPAGVIVGMSGVGSAGNPTAQAGGGAAADLEIVLKRNTSYVITLTPSASTICTLSLFWYEENSGGG
jgi:hypothetical protein